MKSATIPSLRVEPELREAAEKALTPGESLSQFVEAAVREKVRRRQLQDEFIARGLEGLREAELTGEYYSSEEVLAEIDDIIREAETKGQK